MAWLANAVLVVHLGIVLFVVGGLAVIIIGNFVGWRWVNALWFRLLHAAAIAIVVAESWLGIECPLTTLEMWLRTQANETTHSAGFIQHWFQRILYYDAPAWVFTLVYSLFALLVAAVWWFFPPRLRRQQ